MSNVCRASLALVLGLWLTGAAQAGQPAFQEGVDASRAGQHEQALEAFLAAERAGYHSGALYYNLGVTYFRLDQLDHAVHAFEQVDDNHSLAATSHYSIGLIERRRGDHAAAEAALLRARSLATTERLHQLIDAQLERLPQADPRPTAAPDPVSSPRRWAAWLGLDAGYDDNPRFERDTQIGEADGAAYLDALGWAEWRLTAADGADIRLDGFAALTFYPGEDVGDSEYLDLGLTWHTQLAEWRLRPGLRTNTYRVDGDTVEYRLDAGLDVRSPALGDGWLHIRTRAGQVQGGDGYEGLDGQRYQLRLRWYQRLAELPLRVEYQVVYNDRDGYRNGDHFVSASPLHHGPAMRLSPSLGERTQLHLDAGWRWSDYQQPDRFDDGSSQRRKDQRLQLGVGLDHLLTDNWRAAVALQWTRSRSNMDGLDYDRGVFRMGLDRSF